jgi:hypothetical protein
MAIINTGDEAWKVVFERYGDDNSLTGRKFPNIPTISSDAIVPNAATITFNTNTDITPTGGANGDIWYNKPSDKLYKRVAGIWSLITSRAINSNYQPPVQNLTDCPI